MEEWRDLEFLGFPAYELSSLGRIRSHNYMNHGKTKELKPQVRPDGYLQITLRQGVKKKSFLMHRLVAETFIINPDNKLEVNHKDFCRSNCSVVNLEWMTRIENQLHAAHKVSAENSTSAKVTWDIVRSVRLTYRKHSKESNTYALAEKYGVSSNCIRNIITGKTWKEEENVEFNK